MQVLLKTSIPFLRLLVFFFMLYGGIDGQSIGGNNGLLMIPSAKINNDGEFYLGCSYINTCFLKNQNDNVFATWGSLIFLPFLEISLRINTWIHPEKGFYYEKHVGDRMPIIRTQIWKESKKIPSILLGFQDFSLYSTTSKASNFHSLYIVFSKQYKAIDLTLGRGFDFFHANNYQFIGLFGGIGIHLGNKVKAMIEYDTYSFNIGSKISIMKKFQIIFAVQEFQYMSGSIHYHFNFYKFRI